MSTRLLAAALALFAYSLGGTTIGGAEPQLHKGTVVSASAGRLVMKDTAGKEQSFAVTDATKVTVNGKLGKLEDLQETMPVQVTTDEKGKVLAVSTIDKEKAPVLVATGDAVQRPSPLQNAEHRPALCRG